MPVKYVRIMVQRVPAIKYRLEYFKVTSQNTRNLLMKQLKQDPAIVDFYAL